MSYFLFYMKIRIGDIAIHLIFASIFNKLLSTNEARHIICYIYYRISIILLNRKRRQ